MIGSLAAIELPTPCRPGPDMPADGADPGATYPLDPLHDAC